MKKKVCFLVADHPFLDARIFKKEAKTLFHHGYDVTMIVPKKQGLLFHIDGTLFRDTFQQDTFIHEGIKIVTYEQIHFEKKYKLLHHHVQSGKADRFTNTLTRLGIAEQADIYHAHEFFSLYAGVGVKRALGSSKKSVSLIYDSHELVPDPKSPIGEGRKRTMKKMLTAMLQETDYVITVSESIKSWYHAVQPGVPVEVIFNSPPLTPAYEPKSYNKNRLVLGYEGIVNRSRGKAETLFQLLEISKSRFDLHLSIIGGLAADKKEELSVPVHLKPYVHLHGWLPYEDIPQAMEEVDIGLVDLDAKHSLNNHYAVPNKFFSYLNNGVPVLVNRCKDMSDMIHRHQCGFIVDKEQASAADYADALFYLYNHQEQLQKMSQKARRSMEEHYHWGIMEEKLLRLYERL
ncbi:glycosyltransferase family 4 protein [Salibacterium halotolerans]|uniref:Glycosyltransferase involved in cell wall bisynthesis n=1 Tax=Salibacterium halotolerans TaxID=1884432 RepID=A0A1I5XI94_9BACI|nr:glycosyltransferase family 4 protein [Salibacterium halotolerans]SFQ31682.1 Glycosyltransferase involved in cell wall bisynthesis [Salibacterium halotolerans]